MSPTLIALLQNAIENIKLGNHELAQEILDRVLELDQFQVDAIRLKGVIAGIGKNWEESLIYFNKALEVNPFSGVIHSNRGNIYKELKCYEEALKCYEQAIKLEPSYAEAYNNKGNALQSLERYEEALRCYEEAIKLEPSYAEAYNNKGNALQSLERYGEALKCYEEAIKLDPRNEVAFLGAAQVFNLCNQYDYSLGCAERSLEIRPTYVEAFLEKGHTLFQVKNYECAIRAYDQALENDPLCTKALMAKGIIYSEMKEFKRAQEAYSKAYEINPNIKYVYGLHTQCTLQMCEWDDLEGVKKNLIEGVKNQKKVALPYNLISLIDDRLLIKEAIKNYAGELLGGIKRQIVPLNVSKKKLRLGYFSADFHNHPTAYLIAELFEQHDKSQFELIGFVFGRNNPDEMRARIVKAFDQFIDVTQMTDSEIAKLSREMEIDIAIDLKGFTHEARPKIFMFGAAPIQISYLAFPGTMGLECFDYVVADQVLIPKEMQDGMVEKVIYMPNSYQVNDRCRPISSAIKSREELGLPKEGFIYCCFNNNYKITPHVFDGWIRILNSVEGSVLWLFSDNSFAMNNLKREARARGLEPSRLIFADRMSSADHLARYRIADLFLDTSPCNAHTTASDALWAGLPVLTLLGESFAARVASSLLNSVGLQDLIATSQAQYEDMAIDLGRRVERLDELKTRLKKNLLNAPLFDTPLFARNLEKLFLKIYKRKVQGLNPDHTYID